MSVNVPCGLEMNVNKEIVLMTLFLLSKMGMAVLAYLAVSKGVKYSGWFVFLAIAYALFISLKVD